MLSGKVKETKTDALCTRLIIQAELARNAPNAAERRRALARLSQTLFQIARPTFDGKRLADALRKSCTEAPDAGAPAAYAKEGLYANGLFDLNVLSHNYFIEAPFEIKGEFEHVDGA